MRAYERELKKKYDFKSMHKDWLSKMINSQKKEIAEIEKELSENRHLEIFCQTLEYKRGIAQGTVIACKISAKALKEEIRNEELLNNMSADLMFQHERETQKSICPF